jgi:enoyl-CoA hydratase
MTTYTGIDHLSVSLDGNVLSVAFNRPDTLNSLTAEMAEALCEVLESAGADPAVRAVRLSGAGRGFCAGASIGAEDAAPDLNGSTPALLAAVNRAVALITGLPKPVVAVVQGPAAGVGVSLALACDIVLASETAFFLLAFAKVGLMPDGGATALIAASVGRSRALRMTLLAERLSAGQALEYGLISGVLPPEELEAGATAVIEKLATGPTVALGLTKQAINAAALSELEPAISRETEGQIRLLKSHDFIEGATAFQQRRKPTFTDS